MLTESRVDGCGSVWRVGGERAGAGADGDGALDRFGGVKGV